jgi:hypothetical protein
MQRSIRLLLALVLLTAATAPAVASDSLHVARSVFTAEKNKQRHPELLTQTITINQEVPVPRVCIAYENTSKKSQGHGGADILLERVDGTQEEIRLSNEVRDDSERAGKRTFVKCTKADQLADLVPGDMLVFEYSFENMLRLRRKGDTIDRVIVNSVAVADGFPLFVHEVGIEQGEEEKGKKGGWLHSANFNFQAAKKKQKHPGTLTKMVVMQQDVEAPNVCSLYRNTFNKGGKGQVTATASFYRDDEMFDSFNLNERVKKNTARKCKVGQDLLAGDVVYFDFEFAGMPRMAKGSKKTDKAEVTGAIAGNGTPEFASGPSDPTGPSDPGPEPPPPPSGGFSSADLAAAAKVLKGSRPAQLWRFKNNNPTIWTIIGPRTLLGSGPGGINPGTVGYGNTIAAAVADYEKKRGKLAAGGSLNSSEISALTWFRGINTSQGPTSIRMPRNSGSYVGEFYRPGKGVNHQTFGSFVSAINWLKSQGL